MDAYVAFYDGTSEEAINQLIADAQLAARKKRLKFFKKKLVAYRESHHTFAAAFEGRHVH